MPIALIAGALVLIIAVVGVFVLQSEPTPAETAPETPAITRDVAENTVETDVTETTLPAEPVTDPEGPAVSEVTEPPTEPVPAPAETTSYTDGTYTAAASYFTPARKEHDIDVTLTIANDVVTSAAVTYDGGGASSGSHKRFDEAYEAVVLGVSVDSLILSRVGGASLTTDAFNEAVSTIKQQAG